MGCTSSSAYGNNFNVYSDVEVRKSSEFFSSLRLAEREVGKLYEVFKTIDRTRRYSIGSPEFLDFLDIKINDYVAIVLGFFDNERLTFEDFVRVTWRYCSLGPADVVTFVFEIYDCKNLGYLDQLELNALFGDISSKGPRAKAAEFAYSQSYHVTLDDLRYLVTKQSVGLYAPALELHKTLRKRILGEKFWSFQEGKRRSIMDDPEQGYALDLRIPKRDTSMSAVPTRRSSSSTTRRNSKQINYSNMNDAAAVADTDAAAAFADGLASNTNNSAPASNSRQRRKSSIRSDAGLPSPGGTTTSTTRRRGSGSILAVNDSTYEDEANNTSSKGLTRKGSSISSNMSANGFPRNRSGSVHQNQSRGNSFIEDPTANGGPGTGSGSGPNPTRRRSSLGPEDLYTIEEIVEDRVARLKPRKQSFQKAEAEADASKLSRHSSGIRRSSFTVR